MTDIDKLWAELYEINGGAMEDGDEVREIITLTRSELSALVERVRGEAVKERAELLSELRGVIVNIMPKARIDGKFKLRALDKIDALIVKEAR